jgi:hypothetical protein
MKKHICKSCGGPLEDFKPDDVKNGMCPYCVNENGKVKDYKDILDNMIDYITQEHPEIKQESRKQAAQEMLEEESEIWSQKFTGQIIAESLNSPQALKLMTTKKVSESVDENAESNHGFKVWHIHDVEFPRTRLVDVLATLKEDLRSGKWWIDISFEDEVYVVFNGKIFSGSKKDKNFRNEVDSYAKNLGIPEAQLPFNNIK